MKKIKVKESGIYIFQNKTKRTHYKLEKGQEINEKELPKKLIENLINSQKIELIENIINSNKIKKEVKENGEQQIRK